MTALQIVQRLDRINEEIANILSQPYSEQNESKIKLLMDEYERLENMAPSDSLQRDSDEDIIIL